MSECFSPYDPRERDVTCPYEYCQVPAGKECIGVWGGYSHSGRMIAGYEARKENANV